MKTSILTALLTLATVPAHAEQLIHCSTPEHLGFTLSMSDEEGQDFDFNVVHKGFATALHGMNVAIKAEPVTVVSNPILTRTIVGMKLATTLPDGVQVVLQDITYASPSFQKELGIKGVATLVDGARVALACE